MLAPVVAYSESLTMDSYKNVSIGSTEKEALSKLPGYKSTKESYEPDSSCYYLQPKNNEPGALLMILDGVVSRIDIVDGSIMTMEGIKVGSYKNDILSKYKNIEISPHPYISPKGEYLKVKLENGLGIIFETERDIVTSYRLGNDSIKYIEGCL